MYLKTEPGYLKTKYKNLLEDYYAIAIATIMEDCITTYSNFIFFYTLIQSTTS